MDLFRRIFGNSDEETPEQKPVKNEADTASIDQSSKTKDLPEIPPDVIDDPLDPTTYPVSVQLPGKLVDNNDGVTNQLNPDKLPKKHEYITFGQTSEVGLVRSNNQDAALSMFFSSKSVDNHPNFGLFVVADGMGGHHDGEKASAIAARIVASNVTNNIYMPMLTKTEEAERPPITEALVSAVQKANFEVIRQVPDGGTTITAVVLIDDLAHIVHVGDSRAYMMTEDGIEQVTRDHSLVQRLIELEQLTREEAEHHNQKNVLYRAIGQNESLEVDVMTRRLPTNSRLLICSDGLWGQVEESDLFEISMNTPDPQQASEKLVALANTRGGIDNITAILLKVI